MSMEPFKNIYNLKSLTHLATEIETVHFQFNGKKFIKIIMKDLNQLEMKDRVRLISKTLHGELNLSYPQAIRILQKVIGDKKVNGFLLWPISHYIESYGLDHLKLSLNAMKKVTTYFTAEFCLRVYLQKYDQEVFDILTEWSLSKNHHIRRLVSEGTRPNLPWGIKVEVVNKNLARNIKLITPLRNDSSEYVRKSVANHLNDISRLDEELYFKTITSFPETTPEVLKLIRHSSRTLLKAGHPKALKIHGYNSPKNLNVSTKLSKKRISQGDSLPISVEIQNKSSKPQKLLIDYIVWFKKKNGEHSKKVFRLKDCKLGAQDSIKIEKNISFKKVTTRVQYSGKHFLSIQINGKVFSENNFILTV